MRVKIISLCLLLSTAAGPAMSAEGEAAMQLVEGGVFGKALNPGETPPLALQNEAYVLPPLTVECWAKLDNKSQYNILVSNEPKASGTHWELYASAADGVLAVYMPGYSPADVRSNRCIVDGQWHHVAWTFNGRISRLFVDGEEVIQSPVRLNQNIQREPGPLYIGKAAGLEQPIGCDGLIDEVRISSTVRNIDGKPDQPLTADQDTIGLWHMDEVDERGLIPDASQLQNHLRLNPVLRISMDELDRESFKAGPSPLDSEALEIGLKEGEGSHPEGAVALLLDGLWQMAEGGDPGQRLSGEWGDAIQARVPGSVHTALFEAGKIPDPKFGRNDAIAHDKSFNTYWYKTTFKRPQGAEGERLVFNGIAIRCSVWLNGELLGTHDGMFGGPAFDVSGVLQENNTLIVRIDPAPGDRTQWNNPEWRSTVVFNNVWGWHYSSIPALGIWRSVRIEGSPAVRMFHPFVATRDAQEGIVDICIDLKGKKAEWSGVLTGTIQPDNFEGKPFTFNHPIQSNQQESQVHLRMKVPDPQLWWPNDLGAQNLYRMKLSFVPDGGGIPDRFETTFGIRTVEMAPLPGGPKSTQFNWTFVINKLPMFVKGTGWCTMDSSMDFSRERYNRLISLARQQHIQMFRGWGSGMPETDEFYDLCDRAGIMVLQEWPTAWDSHLVQPYDVLEETVRLNTLRIRNHPSLVMYGGGNESGNPFGKAIDMMGKYSIELDGTRAFHRGEPWGGSIHNYNCYWGRQPLDHNLNMTASFIGEFGLACMPALESVLRYLPDGEKGQWPAPPEGSLAHHTPIFNTAEDMSRLAQYSAYFMPDNTLENFITGSQLSQAVGVRHTLELARTRWPDCTGALYYKMNDNYPAASWSCVDWYGVPKIGHYFFQDSFAPLHACVIFKTVNPLGTDCALPVFLLDDADQLAGRKWTVKIEAFDSNLHSVKAETFQGENSINRVRQLGELSLSARQTQTVPLLISSEVQVDGQLVDRTFYFVNYETKKGCLFELPKTRLNMQIHGNKVLVKNEGSLPAVGVNISRPGHLDTFTIDDNYFWLNPGESHSVTVNSSEGLVLDAWNLEK